jgi:transcriptional regulator PpsR
MERDYSKLRDVEFRYRLLFQMSGEAVIIVDASTRRIVEANPAAERLLGKAHSTPFGESFARVFDEASHDDAGRLLTAAQTSNRSPNTGVPLKCVGQDVIATASIFRQERTTQFLVRLVPAGTVEAPEPDSDRRLHDVLERLPDAFVMTDADARILTVNSAFLDLARIGSPAQAEGQLLNSFLGRAGLERDILIDNIRAHGSIRNFSTTLRTQLGEIEDVEISGVYVDSDNAAPCYGLTIRAVRRANPAPGMPRGGLSRSVEQLSELVGRVTLKELVRESTDLVERLCIEAALELTRNNRASAAEILGLSRQGLYSKLHKFGLGNLPSDDS